MEYLPLAGGIELSASPMMISPGRCRIASNVEQIYGMAGYRRIDGYERYDGRQPASAVVYYWLAVASVAGIQPGDILTASVFSAEVVTVDGLRLQLINVTGQIASGAGLSLNGLFLTTATGQLQKGGPDEHDYRARRRQARQHQRDKIQPVPGSGPVRGIAIHTGQVFALRDSADGSKAALWRAEPAGWQLVNDKLQPGGQLHSIAANFAGASTTARWYGTDGVNPPFSCDGSALTFLPVIYDSEATSTTSLTPAAGDLTLTIAETGRSWQTGDELTAVATESPTSRMAGKVKAYDATAKTVTLTVTAGNFTGGVAANWRIHRTDRRDRPFRLAAYKNHLFLAYPNGQLQHSNLGDPLTYSGTAGLLGIGDEITGLLPLKGDVFAIFCRNRIKLLTGSSKADWVLATHTEDLGARMATAVETAGNALFLDARGMTSLAASQTFGNFTASLLSHSAQSLLDHQSGTFLAARSVKRKNQYRLYRPDGGGITASIWRPSPVIEPASVAFTTFRYAHAISCLASGEDGQGNEFNLFGTADGFVMIEDSGDSFDGQSIPMQLALPFAHLKSPGQKKRFHRMSIELDASEPVSLLLRHTFNFDGPFYDPSLLYRAESQRLGAAWDAATFDMAVWSGPGADSPTLHLDGVGTSIGTLILHESDDTPAFIMSGISLTYSIRGMQR